MQAVHRELKVCRRLKHPNIVPLLGIAQVESPLPALVSRWMVSGTLFEYLEKQATIISPPARHDLVSRSFTSISKVDNHHAARLRALLRALTTVRRFLSYITVLSLVPASSYEQCYPRRFSPRMDSPLFVNIALIRKL